MAQNQMSEIAGILRRSHRILAITHIAPDGDAFGSLLGFGWIMRQAAKDVTLVCADPILPEFQFLPGADTLQRDAPPGPWDCVVGLDASDAARLGAPFRPAEYEDTPVLILDHHVTNLRFGTFNWVDTEAAATAQVVLDLAGRLDEHVSVETATCLLTGLVTDTRCFRTSNVTLDVIEAAGRLMRCGASLSEITERVLNYRPFYAIRLWGRTLGEARLEGRVIYSSITREMRSDVGARDNGEGGVTNFLLNAPEATVAAVFTEKADGDIEVSFRSRPGYDVSAVALSLGGGGHPQASGCTIPGPLDAAQARVLPMLQEASVREIVR